MVKRLQSWQRGRGRQNKYSWRARRDETNEAWWLCTRPSGARGTDTLKKTKTKPILEATRSLLRSIFFVISYGLKHRSWLVHFTWFQYHLFLAQMQQAYLILAFTLYYISWKFLQQNNFPKSVRNTANFDTARRINTINQCHITVKTQNHPKKHQHQQRQHIYNIGKEGYHHYGHQPSQEQQQASQPEPTKRIEESHTPWAGQQLWQRCTSQQPTARTRDKTRSTSSKTR